LTVISEPSEVANASAEGAGLARLAPGFSALHVSFLPGAQAFAGGGPHVLATSDPCAIRLGTRLAEFLSHPAPFRERRPRSVAPCLRAGTHGVRPCFPRVAHGLATLAALLGPIPPTLVCKRGSRHQERCQCELHPILLSHAVADGPQKPANSLAGY
jgi:hypothetical protein